jgi:hypothetical protein
MIGFFVKLSEGKKNSGTKDEILREGLNSPGEQLM